jgi:hypothetical protein
MPEFKDVKEKIIDEVIADFNENEYFFERAQELLEDAIEFRLKEAGVEDEDGEVTAAISLTIGAERRK